MPTLNFCAVIASCSSVAKSTSYIKKGTVFNVLLKVCLWLLSVVSCLVEIETMYELFIDILNNKMHVQELTPFWKN